MIVGVAVLVVTVAGVGAYAAVRNSRGSDLRRCANVFHDGAVGPTGTSVQCATSSRPHAEVVLLRTACKDGRTFYETFYGWWIAPGGRIHGVRNTRDLPVHLPKGCVYRADPRNNPQVVTGGR